MYRVHVEPPLNFTEGANRQWPLIFFLHGSGERGEGEGRGWVQQVTRHGPWRSHGCPDYRKGPEAIDRIGRFFVAAPHLPTDTEDWQPELLQQAFAGLVSPDAPYGPFIDRSRCYLTGLSIGGRGVLRFALAQPGLFAAAAPVCPYGVTGLAPRMAELARLPLWFFHGSVDGLAETGEVEDKNGVVGNSQLLYQQLGSARNGLCILPGVGHAVWVHAYGMGLLYDWFLSHQQA